LEKVIRCKYGSRENQKCAFYRDWGDWDFGGGENDYIIENV